jgi:two-component system, OmpR family, sensor histidine kinase KdpD
MISPDLGQRIRGLFGPVGMFERAARPPAAQGYLGGAALVAAAAVVTAIVSRFAELPGPGVLFLGAVVISAILWGRGPAIVCALLSVGALSFFIYEPVYSFSIGRAQDVVDLVVFCVLAVICGNLGGRLRREQVRTAESEELVSRLYTFGRRLAGLADRQQLYTVVLEHLEVALGQPALLLIPTGDALEMVRRTNDDPLLSPADLAAATKIVFDDGPARAPTARLASGWSVRPLHAAGTNVAALAWPNRADPALPVANDLYLELVLGQIAIAIDRVQLAETSENARVEAKAERFREALISSISHDLKTPLASILASATALQTPDQYPASMRAEFAATIRTLAERLTYAIENIVDLSRVRAGDLESRAEAIEVSDIVNAAVERAQPRLAEHRVEVAVSAALPMIKVDDFLIEHALVNLLDNAAKYAPPGSLIRIGADYADGFVRLDVSDEGIGIEPKDVERIFDFSVRGSPGSGVPGSGLGLTICRAFVEASGGRVTASSRGRGKGATFRMMLPLAPEGGVSHHLAYND